MRLVAVGSGTPLMAKDFQEQFKFPGDLYVDQGRKVFEVLKCKRGMKLVLNKNSLSAYKNALKDGHKPGSTQGDGSQLGGTFLMHQNEGVLWQHVEEFVGDHAATSTIVELCQAARKKFPVP